MKDAGLRVVSASSLKQAKLFLRRIRLDAFARQQGIASASVSDGLRCWTSSTPTCRAATSRTEGRIRRCSSPRRSSSVPAAAQEPAAVAPEAANAMDDAPAGVQAPRAGRMAAIGIARADDAALLAEAAADVVSGLDEVDLAALGERRVVKPEG